MCRWWETRRALCLAGAQLDGHRRPDLPIATRTNGVPEGFFRLLISNGSGTYTELSSTDLAVGNIYNLVVRYNVDTAAATLWVNAADETAPGATATDIQTPIQASYVCLRQEPNMGNIYIDDLTILAIWRPQLLTLTPPSGGSADLYFSGGPGDTPGDFAVQRAASLTGGFSDVSATITDLGGGRLKAAVPPRATRVLPGQTPAIEFLALGGAEGPAAD